jgi:glutamine cyclotransferase
VQKFYATDGTDRIFVINPEDWTIQNIINAKDKNNKPLNKLNEMMFIGDKLFINVYLSNEIIQVDPDVIFLINKDRILFEVFFQL